MYQNFTFSNIFKIKQPKSEENYIWEGGGFGCLNPSPSNTNFVADALADKRSKPMTQVPV